jgi:hypothetical protein
MRCDPRLLAPQREDAPTDEKAPRARVQIPRRGTSCNWHPGERGVHATLVQTLLLMSRPRLLLAAMPLLALTAAGGGWVYWTSTPTYALRQLATGFQRHDKALVLRHLDVQATSAQVVGSVFDAASAEAMKDMQAKGGAGVEFAALGVAMVQSLRPAAAKTVEAMVDAALTQWQFDSTSSAAASGDEGGGAQAVTDFAKDFAEGGQTLDGIGRTATWGDSASVELRIRQEGLDTTLALPVLLRKTAGDWKVVGLKGIGAFIVQLEALRERRLAEVNTPIRKQLATMVGVGPLLSEVRQSGWFGQSLTTGVQVENLTDRPIAEVFLSSAQPVNGKPWVLASDSRTIAPKARLTIVRHAGELNPFASDWRMQLARRPDAVTMRVDAAVFEDGAKRDTVRVFTSWNGYMATTRKRSTT